MQFNLKNSMFMKAAVFASMLLIAPSAVFAAEPAADEDVSGKAMYVSAGAWLRYSASFVGRLYTINKFVLKVEGAGKCTKLFCPVRHNGVNLWAARSKVDLSKPVDTVAVETDRTLRNGDEGEDVKAVQTLLVKAGYTVTVDGRYGDSTEEAVRRFQSKSGLPADGAVGRETRKKLGL